jgi:hypothetical protein
VCLFTKELKTDRHKHKSYLDSGEDDKLVVVGCARHSEYRCLLVGLSDEVHPGLISEVVHLVVAPSDALLLKEK